MKKLLFSLIVGVALSFASVDASAQDDPTPTKFYDFNDMLIDGEFRKPTGMFTSERGRARFESLLELRREFIDEITESAMDPALR